MPLRVVRRHSTGALTIDGRIRLKDGRSIRIQRRARSDDPALAEEERAALEAEIFRTDWHGESRGVQTFDEAIASYLKAKVRSENTKGRVRRLRDAIGGGARLKDIDQDTVTDIRERVFDDAVEATVLRELITPLRSILRHAAKRKWCDEPYFETPKIIEGRTLYMIPDEAARLEAAAAQHLRPLLAFLLGTGARLSEAIYLDWRDVDLLGSRAIFWADRTKARKRRNAILPPRVVVELANLPHRDGAVFRRYRDGQPYSDHEGLYGGQIKTGWRAAIRRAGLNPDFTPHTCRHTWATWHYALHKDPLRLMQEGGWSSLDLVKRYAHLMPTGHENAIRRYWGFGDQAVTETA